MNIFTKTEVAQEYDRYYQTKIGKRIDRIEKKLIHGLIKDIPSKTNMLELGCGTGHWTKFFFEQGFRLTATDISDAMLLLACDKHLPVYFIKANAEMLPFENNSFSVVSTITMLEFVDNIDQVLNEIYRVLKPNGWLIAGCLNSRSELGKNKNRDETFKNAVFLDPGQVEQKLGIFGKVKMKFGVHFSPSFEIMDNKADKKKYEPAFIAAKVQKTK